MRSALKLRPRLRSALLPFLVAVPLGCLCAPAALAEQPSSHSVAPEQAAQRPVLDNRARKLAKMLELTDAQQAELAKVLASQREQVRKLWSDQTVLPEYRVSEMRAINDKTEQQIRALLNDAQRKKYVSSRPQQSPSTSQDSNLDYWLNATNQK